MVVSSCMNCDSCSRKIVARVGWFKITLGMPCFGFPPKTKYKLSIIVPWWTRKRFWGNCHSSSWTTLLLHQTSISLLFQTVFFKITSQIGSFSQGSGWKPLKPPPSPLLTQSRHWVHWGPVPHIEVQDCTEVADILSEKRCTSQQPSNNQITSVFAGLRDANLRSSCVQNTFICL